MSDTGVSVGDPTIDAILAGGSVGGAGDAVGGIWMGGNRELGGPGQNAPLGGRRSTSEAVPGLNAPYTAEYPTALWTELPLEDRVRLQDLMVRLGLTSKVIPGEFDDGTVDGLTRLLSLSNRSGTTWQATLGRLRTLEEQGKLGAEKNQYEPQPYLRPDYATLSQRVKDTFRSSLGRDPDEYELQQLATELSGFDALAFEREEELRRMEFDQASTPGVQGGGTVGQVDPIARFKERFEELYAPEIDFVEDKQEAVETEQIMQNTAATVSQAARSSF